MIRAKICCSIEIYYSTGNRCSPKNLQRLRECRFH